MTGSTSEAELARLDIADLLRAGLGQLGTSSHDTLFGVGAVGAAIRLDRAGTIPRSLTYLADLVRSGGALRASALPEPLPEPAQADLVRPWLAQAADVAESVTADDDLARWLEAVATIVSVRLNARGEQLPPRIEPQ